MTSHAHIKVIGANGQVSLGKEFAGKKILIDQISKGTWIIKSGEFVPDTEEWLYQRGGTAKLNKALEWAEKTAPKDNFDQLAKEVENGRD